MADNTCWCRIRLVRPDGTPLPALMVDGIDPPDLATVDHVARTMLAARRLGLGVELTEVAPQLQELLDLVGLAVEVERQPERREQPLGVEQVEEEAHPHDATG